MKLYKFEIEFSILFFKYFGAYFIFYFLNIKTPKFATKLLNSLIVVDSRNHMLILTIMNNMINVIHEMVKVTRFNNCCISYIIGPMYLLLMLKHMFWTCL